MRFVVSSNRVRFLNQAAAIGIVAVIGAGCSSDFSRFDAAKYTASIASPTRVARDQSNPYPGDVDPRTTASISRPAGSVYRRSIVAPPPNPGELIGSNQVARRTYRVNPAPSPVYRTQPYPVRQPARVAVVRPTPTPVVQRTRPIVGRKLPKPVTGSKRRIVQQAPPINNTPRIVRRRPSIDPVTTGSISQARPAVVRKPIAAPKIVRKPEVATIAPKNLNPGVPQTKEVSGWTATGGTSILMREGETLYNVSKRYGVPVKALVKVNNLSDANQVHVGQRIVVPTYIYSRSVPVSAPDNNPKTRAARSDKGMLGEVPADKIIVPTRAPARGRLIKGYKPGLAPMVATPPKPDPVSTKSTYVVASGDNLGAIAQKYSLRSTDIMAANGLKDTNIRVGQKLIIPVSKPSKKKVVGLAPMRTDRITTGSTPKPYTKPGNLRGKDVKQAAPARSGIDKFRWPATGKVLAKFGERKNGARNEGIDISVPVGTAIKATENGVVIYAGTELQDYGKMLLVRHDGGWVSAYAYNSQLNVRRGEKVRRGQTIARSGHTGKAAQPMVHFELRKDANPVNPQKYLR